MSPLPADLGDGAVLRRLTMADLDEIWALIEVERPRLEPWMPWIEGTRTIDDQRRWLESVVRDERTLDGCGIFVDGRYAGGVGLRWDPFGVRGEIGYWIASAEEGRGLVTRAVRALIGGGGSATWASTGSRSEPGSTTRGAARSPSASGSSARGSSAGANAARRGSTTSSCTRSSRTSGRGPRERGIEAVVFDLFGTLVYEFPRADWEAWLETSAAVLEADPDAFRAGWEATAIERQTGRLGDIEANLRTVAARAGAWPTDAQIAEALDQRAAMYRTWFVPRPGAEEVLARLRADGYPLALVSMCAPDTPAMWRSSPLEGTVDAEIFSSDVALGSPTPRSTCSRPSASVWPAGVPLRG